MRLYRLLLRVFPPAFRARFGDDMAETFRDRLQHARRQGGLTPLRFWARTTSDTVVHGIAERRAARPVQRGHTRMRLMDDVVNGWRTIVRRPLFSAGVIAMLAVGLGFNTALYAVVESAFLRPLPYDQPARIAFVWYGLSGDGAGQVNSYADYEETATEAAS